MTFLAHSLGLAQTPQPLPGATAAAQGAAGRQSQALGEIGRLYGRFQALDVQNFETRYQENYELARQMQDRSDQADADFILGYSQSVADFLIEENVKIHSYMAVVGARLGYEELHERHLDVILKRIRRHTQFQGQTAEQFLRDLLARAAVPSGRTLEEEFCDWATASFCRQVSNPNQKPLFEQFRQASGNPVELRFESNDNLLDLSQFDIRVVDPVQASPVARLFASAWSHRLNASLVKNWFIQHFLETGSGAAYPASISNVTAANRDQPSVFIGRSRINIEPEDFFILDPTDREKSNWIDQARLQIGNQQRITLLARIPDGEYYLLRRPQPGSTQTVPSSSTVANLRRDHSEANPPIAYRLILSPSGSKVDVIPIRAHFDFWAKLTDPDFRVLRTGVAFDSESGFQGEAEVRAFHRFSRNFAFQTQFEAAFRRHHDTLDLEDLLPTVIDRQDRLTDPNACQGITMDGSCFDDFNSREFQLDFGPVIRFRNLQVAAMQSVRWVNRSGWDETGTIGQFFFNVGYIFNRGQIGGYFTRANVDESVVRSVPFEEVFREETFLKVANQIGINFNVHLFDDLSMEGAFGRVDSALRDSVPGGTIRVHLPRFWKLNPSAEFGINESFIAAEDSYRFGFSVRFGEWGTRHDPRSFIRERNLGPAPVFVPRVRYETLTRVVREGNRPPVAVLPDDMLGVQPFTRVVVDGSDSFDPDGDAISFEWTKLDDCPAEIVLEDADGGGAVLPESASVSFVIGSDQQCTIQLVVVDSFGARSEPATKRTTSLPADTPQIIRFTADPAEIRQGESSVLTWETQSATTVIISNGETFVVPLPDPTPLSGTVEVRPTATTTYTLIATNAADEFVTAEVTVTVSALRPEILVFRANPAEIVLGEVSELTWETINAQSIEITNTDTFVDQPPSDPLPLSGDAQVSPVATTTYVLTAVNESGETAVAEATVSVRLEGPMIRTFVANPAIIERGMSSELSWETESAENVRITNVQGDPVLAPNGSVNVTPEFTTVYTLTATDESGQTASASVTVTVLEPRPVIEEFAAEPAEIRVGESTRLRWKVQNVDRVTISNIVGVFPTEAEIEITPLATTTFVLTATNAQGVSATAEATVQVSPLLPRIVSFSANPQVIDFGGVTQLSWATRNADRVTITNLIGDFDVNDSQEVRLDQTTIFTLTAFNSTGESVSSDVTVEVRIEPIVISFAADPMVVRLGEDPIPQQAPSCVAEQGGALLSWNVTNALPDSVGISRNDGGATQEGLATVGTMKICVSGPTTFTLTTINGANETASRGLTISVDPARPEILVFDVPEFVTVPGTIRIRWVTRNAARVTIEKIEEPEPGSAPPEFLPVSLPSGETEVVITRNTTLKLTAFNEIGEVVMVQRLVRAD